MGDAWAVTHAEPLPVTTTRTRIDRLNRSRYGVTLQIHTVKQTGCKEGARNEEARKGGRSSSSIAWLGLRSGEKC